MGYAIGKAPTKVGEVPAPETVPLYEGTAPEDMQQWLWSLYRSSSPSILRGGEVSGTSGMSYSVAPAVVLIPWGAVRRVVVPIDPVTVPTEPAPSSGSRVDYIQVGSDGAVEVATSLQENHVLLDKRTVPAGITATTATTSTLGNRRYSPLLGGTMGRLVSWGESLGHQATIPPAETRVFTRTLTIEEDRMIDWRHYMTAAIMNVDDSVFSSVRWRLKIDGVTFKTWEFRVDNIAETRYFGVTGVLNAGTHTLELSRRVRRNPGNTVSYFRGGDEAWPGTNFSAVDLGAAA